MTDENKIVKEFDVERDVLEAMYSILRHSRKRKQRGPMTFVGNGERVSVIWDSFKNCPGQIMVESIKTGNRRIYTLKTPIAETPF